MTKSTYHNNSARDLLGVKHWRKYIGLSMAFSLAVYTPTSSQAYHLEHLNYSTTATTSNPITIQGKVTDEKGEALPGVSISVKGTQQGTLTDFDGNYTLDVNDGGVTLVLSFIGYETKEVAVNNRSKLDIQLQTDTKLLDEVVVVGYGTAKKSDLTGSVARVTGSTFKNQAVTQITDVLAGSVAGFQANQGTGAAGGSSMEIRGTNSLTASSDPMIVVDGVIFNGAISDINPNDIETMDILKDASSAAIYGARAASGVILITTSKGKTGKPTINFTTKLGVSKALNPEFASRGAQGYLDFRRDYFRTLGLSQPSYFWHDPANLPEGVTLEQWRGAAANPNADNTLEWLGRLNFFPTEMEVYQSGQAVDWSKEIFTNAKRQEYDLSIGGGTENASYYWSIGYLDNEGILLGDQFKSIRSRLNVDFKVAKWLNAGINAQYSNRDESTIAADLNGAYTTSPFAKIFNADGSPAWFPHGYQGGRNPLLNQIGQDRSKIVNSLFASIYADVKLPLGITYRLSVQPRIVSMRDYNYWAPETFVGGFTYTGGYASRLDFNEAEWMIDNLVKWNKKIGIHSVDVTLLYNSEQFKDWSSTITNQGFAPSSALGYHGMQFGNKPTMLTTDRKYTGDGSMARINYGLLDKYLFTASVRRDGFSAFGRENPHAIFPAAAFAWKISSEDFFKSDKINELKFRTSWGRNGNRSIGPYSAFSQMRSEQYYDGTSQLIGVGTSTLSNSGLRWEETESLNIGFDLGMFGNRLNATLDLYDATTKNLLVNRSLPRVTGFESVVTNIGALANRGVELTLSSVNIKNDVITWRSNFNFSMNRNKIKRLFGDMGEYTLEGKVHTGEIPDYTNKWFIGQPVDVIWDYKILGTWQVEEAEQAARYNLKPGDIKAEDLDDNGKYEALQDKQFIGFREPRYNFGFRNEVEFLKNFSASIFLRADLGHKRQFAQSVQGWSTFDRNSTANYPYWTPDNRSNEYPRLSNNVAPFGGGIMPYKATSFLRVQDISLSYSLPASLANTAHLKSARVFVSARNIATFTKWPGFDPESGLVPMPKTFTIGLNVSL